MEEQTLQLMSAQTTWMMWTAVATAVAALGSFGAATASIFAIRSARRATQMIYLYQMQHEAARDFADWGKAALPATTIGELSNPLRIDRTRLFYVKVEIRRLRQILGIQRTNAFPFDYSFDCYVAYKFVHEIDQLGLPKATRDKWLEAKALHEAWIRHRIDISASASEDAVPIHDKIHPWPVKPR